MSSRATDRPPPSRITHYASHGISFEHFDGDADALAFQLAEDGEQSVVVDEHGEAHRLILVIDELHPLHGPLEYGRILCHGPSSCCPGLICPPSRVYPRSQSSAT